jgi:hypothetical protein
MTSQNALQSTIDSLGGGRESYSCFSVFQMSPPLVVVLIDDEVAIQCPHHIQGLSRCDSHPFAFAGDQH